MKRVLIATLVLFTSFSFVACKKDSTKIKEQINGDWELRSVYGGFSTTGGGIFQPGNGNKYIFSKDDKYSFFYNGELNDSGSYSLSRGYCPQAETEMDLINFNSPARLSPVFFSIENDTLTMYSGIVAVDGTISKYVHINKGVIEPH